MFCLIIHNNSDWSALPRHKLYIWSNKLITINITIYISHPFHDTPHCCRLLMTNALCLDQPSGLSNMTPLFSVKTTLLKSVFILSLAHNHVYLYALEVYTSHTE